MFQDDILRKSIIASIIASIIVLLLIQPILAVVGHTITWAGDHLYENISRAMYTEAAIGHREKFSFIALALMLSVLAGTVAGQANLIVLQTRLGLLQASVARRIMRWTTLAVSLLTLVFILFFLASNFADFQMNASFNQRLNVLAPQLTDQELKVFRAHWALMETRRDYLAIVEDMEKTAEQQGIRLPKILWK